jgi:hypothetical protein
MVGRSEITEEQDCSNDFLNDSGHWSQRRISVVLTVFWPSKSSGRLSDKISKRTMLNEKTSVA